jgi:hypothetical protein
MGNRIRKFIGNSIIRIALWTYLCDTTAWDACSLLSSQVSLHNEPYPLFWRFFSAMICLTSSKTPAQAIISQHATLNQTLIQHHLIAPLNIHLRVLPRPQLQKPLKIQLLRLLAGKKPLSITHSPPVIPNL